MKTSAVKKFTYLLTHSAAALNCTDLNSGAAYAIQKCSTHLPIQGKQTRENPRKNR